MRAADGLSVIAFASTSEWEQWLDDNHDASQGVWIMMAKKGTGIESVSYPEVLDSALCFGWIDGRREALDERYFLQRYTPRRPRSRWSRINRDKAERLIAEGRMRAAGLAEVQRAQSDGRWETAYEGQRRMVVPDDLQRELDSRLRAKAFFETLTARTAMRSSTGFRTRGDPKPARAGLPSSWPCSRRAKSSTSASRDAPRLPGRRPFTPPPPAERCGERPPPASRRAARAPPTRVPRG